MKAAPAASGALVIRLDVLADVRSALEEARRHHLWAQDTLRPGGPRYRDSLHSNKASFAALAEATRLLDGDLPRALRRRAERLYDEAVEIARATHNLCTALCRKPAPVRWLLPRLTTRLQAKAANDVMAA